MENNFFENNRDLNDVNNNSNSSDKPTNEIESQSQQQTPLQNGKPPSLSDQLVTPIRGYSEFEITKGKNTKKRMSRGGFFALTLVFCIIFSAASVTS